MKHQMNGTSKTLSTQKYCITDNSKVYKCWCQWALEGLEAKWMKGREENQ